RNAKEDHRARLLKRKAVRFERTQISRGTGQREGKFLRLRAAGVVYRPRIGRNEWPGEPARRESRHELAETSSALVPRQRARSGRSRCANRIEAEANCRFFRSDAVCAGQVRKDAHDVRCAWPKIQLEGNARVQMNAVEHALERGGGRGYTI